MVTGGGLTHRQILTIMAGLMMGMFLASLDQTIVSSAMRVIADDLHNLSGQAWVVTAYLITSTIVTPLYGKLSDIYGRKPFFTAAIVIFLIGSVLCSFATSMPMLAGFRAVQGLGAGGLSSLALAIIGDIVPPRERARYQRYFLAVFGTSSVLGPVVGGFFAGQATILGITTGCAGSSWSTSRSVSLPSSWSTTLCTCDTPAWTTGSGDLSEVASLAELARPRAQDGRLAVVAVVLIGSALSGWSQL